MPKSAYPDEILTVAALAAYLRCHPSTIYRLLGKRKIPAFKIGTDWRFQRSEVDQWIATQPLQADLVKTRDGRPCDLEPCDVD